MRYGLLLMLSCSAAPLLAQGHASHDHDMMSMAADPHMRTTPLRAAQPGDQARADSIVTLAREALAKYRDVRVAEADGFKRFAADVPNQRVYHYNRLAAVLKARFALTPRLPHHCCIRTMVKAG